MDSVIQKLNKRMIKEVQKKGFLKNSEYERAFLSIPRHIFIPSLYDIEKQEWKRFEVDYSKPQEEILKKIYVDSPLVINVENETVLSTSSQPTVMAMMIEEAKLKNGDKVFEVGTGSGYNAGVISHIVGQNGKVITTELEKKVYEKAKANLKRSGIKNIEIYCMDGGLGYPKEAPFDKIIITTSSSDITEEWIRQLNIGGILVLPLVTRGIEAIVSLKKEDNKFLKGEIKYYVRFLTMRGLSSSIMHYGLTSKRMKPLYRILKNYAKEDAEIWKLFENLKRKKVMDFFFFLALNDEEANAFISDEEEAFEWGYGLWGEKNERGIIFVFRKKAYSWGDTRLKDRFIKHFRKWQSTGTPTLQDFGIKCQSVKYPTQMIAGEYLIRRRYTNTIFFKK